MVPDTAKPKRTRIAVLISGNGTNLQALLDNQRHGSFCPYEITLVFSNQKKAYGLERARRANVPVTSFSQKEFATRTDFEKQLLKELNDFHIDLVVLAGFMRVLSPYFVNAYKNRILNIHPSLLPKFPGLHAVEQALNAGAQRSGCTVHLVDDGVDTGPIVAQETVPVLEGDTAETLHARIHEAEHRLYPAALAGFCMSLSPLSN